jgi:hypothetical protein
MGSVQHEAKVAIITGGTVGRLLSVLTHVCAFLS